MKTKNKVVQTFHDLSNGAPCSLQAALAEPKSKVEEEEEEEEKEKEDEEGREADRRERRQLKTERSRASPTVRAMSPPHGWRCSLHL